MFEDYTASDFDASPNFPEVLVEAPVEALPEVEQASPEVRPKSALELAEEYSVSDRAIQSWFKAVATAYYWIDAKQLKSGNGNKTRYTPLCQNLIAQYRGSNLSEDAWIASVHEAHPHEIPADVPVPQPSASLSAASGESAMVPYQAKSGELEQFTPPERKIFKFTSTDEFTETAKANTETALDVTQSNSTSLVDALINQARQDGQKLGVELFNAKYGTAHLVYSQLEQSLAKKSGLVEEPQEPTAG